MSCMASTHNLYVASEPWDTVTVALLDFDTPPEDKVLEVGIRDGADLLLFADQFASGDKPLTDFSLPMFVRLV